MMFLSISILLCGALLMCSASDQQHSSFYGICTPNNSSDAIYSQTIHIKNSGIVQRPPQPIRQWMISVRDIFRRRNPTTVPSTLSDVRISQILTYPPFGQRNEHPIKCIKSIDLSRDGTGGFSEIIGGGVGKTWARIQLNSQPGRDIHFNITIVVDKQHEMPRNQLSNVRSSNGWNMPNFAYRQQMPILYGKKR